MYIILLRSHFGRRISGSLIQVIIIRKKNYKTKRMHMYFNKPHGCIIKYTRKRVFVVEEKHGKEHDPVMMICK